MIVAASYSARGNLVLQHRCFLSVLLLYLLAIKLLGSFHEHVSQIQSQAPRLLTDTDYRSLAEGNSDAKVSLKEMCIRMR